MKEIDVFLFALKLLPQLGYDFNAKYPNIRNAIKEVSDGNLCLVESANEAIKKIKESEDWEGKNEAIFWWQKHTKESIDKDVKIAKALMDQVPNIEI